MSELKERKEDETSTVNTQKSVTDLMSPILTII